MTDAAPPDTTVEGCWTELAQRAARAGVRLTRLLHHTDKAIVAAGARAGTPVVAKLLTTDQPYWIARREHELAVYRHFDTHPPAVRAPRLIAHDDRLTVLAHVPGERLHDQRHLDRDLTRADADQFLDTLDRVTAWRPMPALPEPVDYPARVAAEHAAGLLDGADDAALHRLLAGTADEPVTAHGDPLPANLLIDGDNVGLVDWEHCGQYLPGWDLAVLYTVGAHASPTLAQTILDRVDSAGIGDTFAVNAILLCCREIRMHQALPPGPVRADRLAALAVHQQRVRVLLRDAG